MVPAVPFARVGADGVAMGGVVVVPEEEAGLLVFGARLHRQLVDESRSKNGEPAATGSSIISTS